MAKKTIDKVEMGRMYEEMAEINLGIAEESFHAESEAEGTVLHIVGM